ncbi:MAG: peptidoglycan-binding domain-containing protein [Paracoccus sp. (in: a-proteobacteria)]
MMKRTAILLLSVVLPGLAAAEDVYIRIEAKRGQDAARQSAAQWRGRITDLPVVTFPLGPEWEAVAFGPLPREAAKTRMDALKQSRTIPADSLLTPAANVTVSGTDGNAPELPGTDTPPASAAADASTAGLVDDATFPVAAEPPAPPLPDHFIRIQTYDDRSEADTALDNWRRTIPEAGLWQVSDGGFSIAAGPLSETGAGQWLELLKSGKAIPDGSQVLPLARIGKNLTPGNTPEWPEAPENPPEMPPMTEIQDLLKWAGFYNGEIDGKSGPITRAAIAASVAAQRETASPALALLKLREHRNAWREELGLSTLDDDHTGLSLSAPLQRLTHLRTERGLSIYGPKDGSGAALILFSQPGGQQEMEDLAGLVTALGWVPAPQRDIGRGRTTLSGRNETHTGRSESRVSNGQVEGWVLIWPVADAENAPRIAAEIADSFTRTQPTRAERDAETAVNAPATETVSENLEEPETTPPIPNAGTGAETLPSTD